MKISNARELPEKPRQEFTDQVFPKPGEPELRVLPVSKGPGVKSPPQQGLVFRIVAFFTHLQLTYLVKNPKYSHLFIIIYVFLKGAVALGIITAVAFVTHFPLLFPPLGPSAFILFNTPMSPAASPRNVILSHTIAMASGLFSLYLFAFIFPNAQLNDPQVMSWPRVAVIALAMGMTGALLIAARSPHPPAAATAIIAALGYSDSPSKVAGLLIAVALLVLQASLFNRILGGLPYPIWKCDPKVAREYGALAGLPDETSSFWQRMTAKVFQRR